MVGSRGRGGARARGWRRWGGGTAGDSAWAGEGWCIVSAGRQARRMAWVACRIIVGIVGDAMLSASDVVSQIRPKGAPLCAQSRHVQVPAISRLARRHHARSATAYITNERVKSWGRGKVKVGEHAQSAPHKARPRHRHVRAAHRPRAQAAPDNARHRVAHQKVARPPAVDDAGLREPARGGGRADSRGAAVAGRCRAQGAPGPLCGHSAAARHVPCCSAPCTCVVIAKMRAALLLYSADTPLALSYAHAHPKSYSQRRRAALSPVAQPHSPRLVTASVTSYVRLPRLRVTLRE